MKPEFFDPDRVEPDAESDLPSAAHVPSLTSAEAEARATMENVQGQLDRLRRDRARANEKIRVLVEQENELRPVINAFDRAAKRRNDMPRPESEVG